MLALDWDQKVVHLVSAQVGRGKVLIDRAVQWHEEGDLTPANAEQAGPRLREHLKAAGLAPAPILVCLGRERVILKDIRYPQVAPSDEPALVRFQAAKELTDSPDEVVIDYCPYAETGHLGERHAMAVAAKRDLVKAYQTLCRSAGLKLLGLTPRPFGVAGAIERATGVLLTPKPATPDTVLAVLTIGERWAELCITQGTAVLFARSLGLGPQFAGEVKRSLAVYAGGSDHQPPQMLYVAGNGEHGPLRERLQEMLNLPVHALDPFAREEQVQVQAAARGGFTGAVGLLHLWGQTESLPINFVRPREAQHQASPSKRRWLLGAGVAAVVLVGLVLFFQSLVAMSSEERDRLVFERNRLNNDIARLQTESTDLAAIRDWEQTTVPVLDELYDLTARMEFREGFKVNRLVMTPTQRAEQTGLKKTKDNPYIAQMTIAGLTPKGQENLVHNLVTQLHKDKHLKTTLGPSKPANDGIEFQLTADVAKQPAAAYVDKLAVDAGATVTKGSKFGKKKGGRS